MRRVAKDDRRVSRHAWLLVVCVRRIARHEHAFALGQRAALGPASVEEGVGLAALVHDVHVARALVVLELELQPRAVLPVHCHVAACGATARGTYGTPGAETRKMYEPVAQQLPCASGKYAAQEAGTCSLYVQYGGSGTYGSA